jgi:membrane protein
MEMGAQKEPSRPRPSPWQMVKEGFGAFIADNGLTRGAAIAFYAVTALAPVLFITTAIAGAVLGPHAASGAVRAQLRRIMTPESANLVQFAIVHAARGHHTVWGSLVGVVALVVTASGVFTEMEDALNIVWKAPRKESYLHQLLRGRVLSLILVVALGFLLILSMIVASGIGWVTHLLDHDAGLSRLVTGLLDFALSFALLSLLFAAIYKLLPNTRLYWRDVLAGACGTALLFQGGQALIGFYLATFISANIYGAAAGVIVLLVWVYYAAMVFLLGAEFTRVWTRRHGRHPTAGAVPAPPAVSRAPRPGHRPPPPPRDTSAGPGGDPA